MVVRIRIPVAQRRLPAEQVAAPPVASAAPAPALPGLLTLASVLCFSMGIWLVFADLGWLAAFLFTDGVLSHWQLWMAVAVLLQLIAFRLNRLAAAAREASLEA